jgi:hypothetical protein
VNDGSECVSLGNYVVPDNFMIVVTKTSGATVYIRGPTQWPPTVKLVRGSVRIPHKNDVLNKLTNRQVNSPNSPAEYLVKFVGPEYFVSYIDFGYSAVPIFSMEERRDEGFFLDTVDILYIYFLGLFLLPLFSWKYRTKTYLLMFFSQLPILRNPLSITFEFMMEHTPEFLEMLSTILIIL